MNHRVTIAIPTYNRAQMLPRAIESALGQTYPQLQVLVCDDCSHDNTQEVLAGYHDARLRVVRNQTNLGLFKNVNACLERAEGAYFLLLMDDDYLEPICVQSLLVPWQRRQDLGFVYGQHWIETDSTRTLPVGGAPEYEDALPFVRGWWKGERPCYLNAILFNTQRLRTMGGFPPIYTFDAYALLRSAFEGLVAHVPHPLSHYVIHTATLSNTVVDTDHILGDRCIILDMCMRQAARRGLPPQALASLRKIANRQQAMVACSSLLILATQRASKASIFNQALRHRVYLGHEPLISLPSALAALCLPATLAGTLRSAVRRFRSRSHSVEPRDARLMEGIP